MHITGMRYFVFNSLESSASTPPLEKKSWRLNIAHVVKGKRPPPSDPRLRLLLQSSQSPRSHRSADIRNPRPQLQA